MCVEPCLVPVAKDHHSYDIAMVCSYMPMRVCPGRTAGVQRNALVPIRGLLHESDLQNHSMEIGKVARCLVLTIKTYIAIAVSMCVCHQPKET